MLTKADLILAAETLIAATFCLIGASFIGTPQPGRFWQHALPTFVLVLSVWLAWMWIVSTQPGHKLKAVVVAFALIVLATSAYRLVS